ncbi:MAG: helix-turn-helix transcriptional regulator [Selenomonadaceae bacterium]|nr:helix-turn-helix transcriptional regulator [Selenomonadaceae bacterium]
MEKTPNKPAEKVSEKSLEKSLDKSLSKPLNEIQYIGLRIGYFRKLRNLTQAELAEKLSINKNYLSHIERGSMNKVVSLPLLIKISRALDVEFSLLVDLQGMNKPIYDIKNEFKEMKEILEQMKEFITEIDEMFKGMQHIDNELDEMLDQMDKLIEDVEDK